MDVFALPSIEREGLPISIIEAMALAKPVVVSRLGGIPEVVDEGKTGLLVNPGDGEALTLAIDRLLKSTDIRDAMRLQARTRYLERFTLKHMLEKIELLYEPKS
jgi:glycosyltransferase involved in cell wall biosynthesis